MRIARVTIVNERVMPKNSLNDLLLLFGTSLGLFSLRDKDKSCYRIFIVLIKALKAKVELTSDELATQTGLSRGTVVHHLNRLMAAGIITNFRNKYFINYDNLEDLVVDLKRSVDKMFDSLSSIASQIDDSLNIKHS